MMQASLLDQLPVEHDIFTEPVPENLTLRPGLVNIWISRTNAVTGEVTKFKLPVQWTEKEAGELIYLIRGVSWQIDKNDGDSLPIDYYSILDICEKFVDGEKHDF